MAFLNPKDCIPDKTTVINGVTVKEYLLKNHNINNISLPGKRTKKLLGITIHNTDDLPKIEDDGKSYIASTSNNNMKSVRVHLYVDDMCAWQNLEWESQNWSCADGSGNGNTATIAIECIMKSTNDPESLKARDNCARLTAWLLKKYGLTTKDVYTHTYWLNIRDKTPITKTGTKDQICTARHSYKTCPIYIIPKWYEFLDLVNTYLKALGGKVETVKHTPLPSASTEKTPKYLVDYKNEQTSKVVVYDLSKHGNLFLSPHFQVKEFKSPDSNIVKIDNRLIWILERLFNDLQCSKMTINSGYRTSSYSVKVGGSTSDYHTKGMAADIRPYDKNGKIISAKIVCCKLCDHDNVFGIGYISETAVHCDTRPKSVIWFGDETNGTSLIRLGYSSFYEYFGSKPSKPSTQSSFKPYIVRVVDPELNIRADAGMKNKVVGVIKDKGAYTITEEKTVNGSVWGLLKGYSKYKNGWINVSEKYVKKI